MINKLKVGLNIDAAQSKIFSKRGHPEHPLIPPEPGPILELFDVHMYPILIIFWTRWPLL